MNKKIGCTCVLTIALLAAACSQSPEGRASKFVAAGKAYIAKKDYARAFLEFKNAAAAVPKDAEPPYQLALTYLALGDVDSGLSYLRKSVALNPKHAEAQIKLSEVLARQGDRPQAQEAQTRLRQVLLASPANGEALVTLAFAEGQLGNLPESEKLLERAVDRSPGSLDALLALTRVKLGQSDLRGAEEILRKAAANPSRQAESIVALGELLFLTNRGAEAEQRFNEALQIDTKCVPALIAMARLRHAQGRANEAAQLCRRVSELKREYKTLYATYLAQTGKRNEATQELDKLYKADTTDREVRTRLIYAHLSAGSIAEAERILDEAMRNNPKDLDGRLQRSVLYLRAGNPGAAQDDLAEVLRLRPASPGAHYLLSRIHRSQGVFLSQRQTLEKALALDPGMLLARLELAQSLVTAGASGEALKVLDGAPEYQKNDVAILEQRNRVHLALGDKDALRKGIDAGLSKARTPELLLQNALAQVRERKYDEARNSLKEALKQNPEDARLVEALARVSIEQRPLPQAITELRSAVSSQPNSVILHQLLGQLLATSGNLTESREELAKAVALDSKSVAAALALAQVDTRQNRFADAKATLSRILAVEHSADARLLLAQVEQFAGNSAAAMEQYRKVLDLEPANVVALNNLANRLAASDQMDEALKFAERAKEIAPDSPAIGDTLGWILCRKGHYQLAARHLEQAVRQEPTPVRRMHLGIAYFQSGDQQRGREILTAVLRNPPDTPEARLAQDLLRGDRRN